MFLLTKRTVKKKKKKESRAFSGRSDAQLVLSDLGRLFQGRSGSFLGLTVYKSLRALSSVVKKENLRDGVMVW